MTPLNHITHNIIQILVQQNYTIATFESCTGGAMINALTNVSGSSQCVKGGLVAYDSQVKIKNGDIDPALITKYGVVSPQVAQAMAQKTVSLFNVNVAISCTGNLSPLPTPHKKAVAYVGIFLHNEYYSLCVELPDLGLLTRAESKAIVLTKTFKHLFTLLHLKN